MGAVPPLQACKATSWDFIPPDQDPVPSRGRQMAFRLELECGKDRRNIGVTLEAPRAPATSQGDGIFREGMMSLGAVYLFRQSVYGNLGRTKGSGTSFDGAVNRRIPQIAVSARVFESGGGEFP